LQDSWNDGRYPDTDSDTVTGEKQGGRTMTIQMIFKIAAVGILISVLNQVLKHSGREDQAYLTSLAGLILVLFWIVPYVAELFATIQDLFQL